MNHTICTVKDCPNKGRYCRLHPSGSLKEPKKIKAESDKRATINRKEYNPKAAKFRQENPNCKINSPVCTGKTECVHHMRGKDSTEDLLDERYWMPACFKCNTYVEQNDLWARVNGFKLSKHSKRA